MKAYLRPNETLLGAGRSIQWWSFPPDQRETAGYSKFDASPAFLAPADSEKFNASGIDWACGGRCHTQLQKAKDVEVVEFDNVPFTNLRWVGIDSRMQGGVAYKVVTPQGWLVDLREDVLLECLFEGAMQPLAGLKQGAGTYLTAKFVWVVLGSQVRIVRVGSKVHQEIVDSENRRDKTKLTDAELEAGGVYINASGAAYVLVGIRHGKGNKYLVARADLAYTTVQALIRDGIKILKASNPSWSVGWGYTNKLNVVEKIGEVDVPANVTELYDKHVEQFRR
jgi:hypothetical protein